MPDREPAVVDEWSRRRGRQVILSRSVFAAIGLVVLTLISAAILGPDAPALREVRPLLPVVLLALVAWVFAGAVLSRRTFRCPKCGAFQGRRELSPTACRSCGTPFV